MTTCGASVGSFRQLDTNERTATEPDDAATRGDYAKHDEIIQRRCEQITLMDTRSKSIESNVSSIDKSLVDGDYITRF
jgi:hypothetical protein